MWQGVPATRWLFFPCGKCFCVFGGFRLYLAAWSGAFGVNEGIGSTAANRYMRRCKEPGVDSSAHAPMEWNGMVHLPRYGGHAPCGRRNSVAGHFGNGALPPAVSILYKVPPLAPPWGPVTAVPFAHSPQRGLTNRCQPISELYMACSPSAWATQEVGNAVGNQTATA